MSLNELIRPIYDKLEKLDNSVNTYCNVFVAEIMSKLNYHDFDGRVANRIVEMMDFDKASWQKITAETWDGKSLVVAGLQGEIHGHICPLIEGQFESSGKWKKELPLCANIGRNNFWGKGVNWAFIVEPVYYKFIKK
jgi:hypothetical protein